MLKDYKMTTPRNMRTLHVLSTDGSDLGWGRLTPVASTMTIDGTHADMLSSKHSKQLAERIILLTKKM
ncbi:hypothetical protein ANCCAN_09752 [Ancylostoma caninum]|uniref:Uncharacterized protein n=1 Tax=Ancylostoma caninum TaxID=29170 RepID=A0A368GIN3_ANCCA|nr:hypothetical protein ANCCAN_09752 [Ancylostoma caninum]